MKHIKESYTQVFHLHIHRVILPAVCSCYVKPQSIIHILQSGHWHCHSLTQISLLYLTFVCLFIYGFGAVLFCILHFFGTIKTLLSRRSKWKRIGIDFIDPHTAFCTMCGCAVVFPGTKLEMHAGYKPPLLYISFPSLVSCD